MLLGDEVGLVGDKLALVAEARCVAKSGEVKVVERVMDKGKLITSEGWV